MCVFKDENRGGKTWKFDLVYFTISYKISFILILLQLRNFLSLPGDFVLKKEKKKRRRIAALPMLRILMVLVVIDGYCHVCGVRIGAGCLACCNVQCASHLQRLRSCCQSSRARWRAGETVHCHCS